MNSLTREHFENLIYESFSFDHTLENLSNKNYPEPKVKDFIERELLPINRLLREQLIKYVSKSEDVSPEFKIIKSAWDYFCRIVGIVGAADIRSSPVEVIKVIDYWLKGVEDNYLLLVTPMNELNFSFQEIWLPFANFLKENLEYEGYIDYSVINLCFPINEKDNIFLYPIYAHEIGHFIDYTNYLTEEVLKANIKSMPESVKSLVKVQVQDRIEPVQEALAVSVIIDAFLKKWINEIVADTFGIFLAGPAFLYAGRYFDVNVSRGLVDQISKTHPPNRLRLIYRWQLLEDFDFSSKMPESLTDKVKEYVEFWSKTQCAYIPFQYRTRNYSFRIEFDNETLKECESFILSLKSDIVHKTISALGTSIIISKDSFDVTLGLIKRLSGVIPPNETSDKKPVSPDSILNVAWMAKFLSKETIKSNVGRLNEPGDYSGDFEAEEIIKNLSRYAIMVSDVQRKWEDK